MFGWWRWIRSCEGQTTLEACIVMMAFLSLVLGIGAILRHVSQGGFLQQCIDWAPHSQVDTWIQGLKDVVVY